ncbi:thiamine pyrophosphate-binding protein [Bosea sp. (in: a-proteobacteria)]|uniref:thiamine pyrophosphate-binding protein n=1 Tax=Bosea sp. (in: a-proteobacteria) TaxID=1871050 RepID=UPI00262360E7|nr:thiamine pyrophosphate-binding protein [Bosea sp. (in: a-proteobacteria)]MCO5089835.1 thiamine pyrophosphate-binding protein [Bosea sp. (in: a-proteobacteria)]
MSKTAAHAIIDHLVAEGVKYIFICPPTNHSFPFLDALYDRQNEIKPILVRHEAMAPWMAEAWYRMTGQPGVFHVGAGPALANTVIGVMTAYGCGSAIIGISGNVNSEFFGRNGMQEIQGKTFAEGHRILEPVVKRLWQVTNAGKMPEVMTQAFAAATTGRPGPVHIDVPMDVFEQSSPETTRSGARHRPSGLPSASPEQAAAAFDLIAKAKAPVLLAGGGTIAAKAGANLRALAELMSIPVVTSYTGKGALPDDHALAAGPVGAMGVPGAMKAVQEADLVIALGHRFGEHSTCGWEVGLPYSFPPAKLIQIDIDPVEIGRYYPVEIGLQADINATLGQWIELARKRGLRDGLKDGPRERTTRERRQADRDRMKPHLSDNTGPIRPERLVAELRAALGRNAVMIPDAGNNGNYFNTLWDVYEPGTYIADRGSAAMGYAPAAALGVKLAEPDRDVVAVTGDGCMTQVNWVLGTAAEYNIPAKFVVINDSALGGCLGAQNGIFDGRVLGTRFEYHNNSGPYDQDFAMLARSYGVEGKRVTSPDELAGAIAEMLAHPAPYVLDVVIDKTARPIGAGRIPLSNIRQSRVSTLV